MLLGEMIVISRVEPFDRVRTYFLEVIGPLLTACRFTEFDTSVIYHVLILCLCSFLL